MKPNGGDEQLEMSSRIARNPRALNRVMKNRSAEPYSRTTPPHFKGQNESAEWCWVGRQAGGGGARHEVGYFGPAAAGAPLQVQLLGPPRTYGSGARGRRDPRHPDKMVAIQCRATNHYSSRLVSTALPLVNSSCAPRVRTLHVPQRDSNRYIPSKYIHPRKLPSTEKQKRTGG